MDKNELLAAMSDSYAKLNEQIGKMTDDELNATFQFANDPKKCGARWIYDQCARDLLIHLYEWQVLMREFVNNIREGRQRDYLPDEYRKNYHEMRGGTFHQRPLQVHLHHRYGRLLHERHHKSLQAGPEDVENAPKDVEDFVLMSLRLLVSLRLLISFAVS